MLSKELNVYDIQDILPHTSMMMMMKIIMMHNNDSIKSVIARRWGKKWDIKAHKELPTIGRISHHSHYKI